MFGLETIFHYYTKIVNYLQCIQYQNTILILTYAYDVIYQYFFETWGRVQGGTLMLYAKQKGQDLGLPAAQKFLLMSLEDKIH